MVQLEGVSYDYARNRQVFSDLNLEMPDGRICGLLGKNGAGKTTLLKLIAGLLFPQHGKLNVFSNDPTAREPKFLNDLFFVPEEFDMPTMTPAEYGATYGSFYTQYDSAQFRELLEKLEVIPTQKMSTMSFGQKKKSLIAFALACNTALLIMDEPTNGLDIPSKASFRRVVSSLMDQKRTIIISTHQVRDLEQLIDSVIILDNSKILLNATMEQITERLVFKHVGATEQPIYSEQTPHGTWGVMKNDSAVESQVDMELLFNAAMTDKDFFINNLVK